MTIPSYEEIIDKMCGGKGHVIIKRLLGEKELDGKCGLFAQVTLEKGCSLGYHEHHGETETYHILSGQGEYQDNQSFYSVKAGDTTFCPDGSGHALVNTGNEPLVFIALIIKK
ncbi:MAG: cupin domain-containing protein [Eubacteriales bacterium]|nr:cupin domain-containing protein [Eubacteriales bacterium]